MSVTSPPDPNVDAAGDEPSPATAEAHGDAAAAISGAGQLAEARVARGWSVADVSAKLGMVPRQIEAIERGQWDALPGHAFVRGAIRAYGKALQVDVAPLLDSVGGTVRAAELRPSVSLDAPLPKRGALGFDSGGSGSRLTWILLSVLGVIAIAMYFGRGAEWSRALEGDAPSPAAPQSSIPAPSPATPNEAPPAASSAPPLAPVLAPSVPAPSVQAQSGPAEAAASTAGQGAPATIGAASAEGAVKLRFRFEREAWVEVRDRGGRLVLSGMQPADSVREIAGRGPYHLVVGNADHVRLDHDGRPIDLGAIARQGVARLTID